MVITKGDMDTIKAAIKSTINEQFLQEIADKVVSIISEKFQSQIDEQREIMDDLRNKVRSLEMGNLQLISKMDAHEQAARSLNIRIFGISEATNEDIRKVTLELFTKKLKVSVKDSDIKRCYRVGVKNREADKPPAILVTFYSDVCRASVLKSRKELKHSGVTIKEDLTKVRLSLLNSAIEKYTYKNTWCLNGNIYVKCNNVVHRINNRQELDSL